MPANKIKTPKFGFFGRHKITSLIILVTLLGIAGIFIYQKIALELNKRDFQNARTAIDSVYADIVRQVGPPDNYKKVNQCVREHEELTQGSLFCNIDTTIIYGVKDRVEASSILAKVQGVITNEKQFKLSGHLSRGIQDRLVTNTYYHTAEDNYRYSNLDCVASYVYDTPGEISLSLQDKNMQPLEISFGCNGPAKQSYY
jgi:hypothetical protein